ncbi:MAG: nucleoside deaminase [Alphaproteobacteria bacterium]|nr:nucleoside deaminase [Alphaproteobacteria bacterium]
MEEALALAADAAQQGEVPVAAIITTAEGEVVARAANRVERDGDPTAHAEILAIRAAAARLGSPRLEGCDLWVTLEPCPMCAGAIAHARIKRLYYGAEDPKSGGVSHGPRVFNQTTCHHQPEVYSGISGDKAGQMLTSFFQGKRG